MLAPASVLTAKLTACDKVLLIRRDGKTEHALTKARAEAVRVEVDEPTRQLIESFLSRMVAAVFHVA